MVNIVDIFLVLALVALIGFLITLIVFLIKLTKTVKEVNSVFEKNRTDIDLSIRKAQETINNVSNITDKTDRLLGDISPDIRGITSSTNKTMGNVENIVGDMNDTVEFVSESIVDTADTIRSNLTSCSSFTPQVLDLIKYFKSIFGR